MSDLQLWRTGHFRKFTQLDHDSSKMKSWQNLAKKTSLQPWSFKTEGIPWNVTSQQIVLLLTLLQSVNNLIICRQSFAWEEEVVHMTFPLDRLNICWLLFERPYGRKFISGSPSQTTKAKEENGAGIVMHFREIITKLWNCHVSFSQRDWSGYFKNKLTDIYLRTIRSILENQKLKWREQNLEKKCYSWIFKYINKMQQLRITVLNSIKY